MDFWSSFGSPRARATGGQWDRSYSGACRALEICQADVRILFNVHSDEPEVKAGAPAATGRHRPAFPGQNRYRTKQADFLLFEFDGFKGQPLIAKIFQNLLLIEHRPVRTNKHVTFRIESFERRKIPGLQGSVKRLAVNPAHFRLSNRSPFRRRLSLEPTSVGSSLLASQPPGHVPP